MNRFITLVSFIFAAMFVLNAQAQQADSQARPQLTGVGIAATMGTGYGLYAVTMRASKVPGVISSFYAYSQNGTYPARWHEIDLEFTPGFTGVGKILDNNHPHALAKGQCFDPNTNDGLPLKGTGANECSVQPFLTGKAGSDLSFNTYNHRAIDGEPYMHSNDQVFVPSTHGDLIFNNYYTYYIYYTPKGIYWTKDLPAVALPAHNPPATLPNPSFVKKDFNIVNDNPTWRSNDEHPEYQVFQYDSLPLSPKLSNGQLAASGALMYISMNIWDGTNTDPTHQQDWGGETPPSPGASSSYKYVAYYPLKTPVNQVNNDPTTLQYGAPTIYSDFTTQNGTFLLNQKPTTFTTLWQVSNGSYLWPLGQLDPRNLMCGKGSLTMTLSNNYKNMRPNSQPFTNCSWLNQN